MSSTILPRATATKALLERAVHRNPVYTVEGLRERSFTLAFSQLVYPQIWEDPDIDMEALAITPDSRILTIASGGCNALSYLTANPEQVTAVDLNQAHVALNRLKHAVIRHAPNHHILYRFFGTAQDKANIVTYDQWLRPHLDDTTRAYWDQRDMLGRRRISLFARGLYRHGLLGRFIGMGHRLARLMGANPRDMLRAQTLAEQRAIFEATLAPLFDKPLLRAILNSPASLYGLGIPPQQYEALAEGRPMAQVIRERLEKLACDFPLRDNYYAWQAFGRGYEAHEAASLPPYLQARHFETMRERIGRIEVKHISLLDELAARPVASLDRYILLDAQDWMTDADMTSLWRQITRTARPGARVIFRTAGTKTILPGRIPDAILSRWTYQEEASADWTRRDRSAIYGGFHLYVLNDEA